MASEITGSEATSVAAEESVGRDGEPVAGNADESMEGVQESLEASDAEVDDGDEGETHPIDEDSQQPDTRLLDMFGDDSFKRKYRNDAEFRKGIKEMAAALSRRDEFASYGRALAQYENEFREFLMAKHSAASNNAVADNGRQEVSDSGRERKLPSAQEIALLKAKVLDTNGGVREGAKPEDIRKLQEVTEVLEQRMYEYLLDPEGFVDRIIQDRLSKTGTLAAEKAREEIAKLTTAQSEAAKINQFVDANASWIFVNGRDATEGRTPLGEQLRVYAEQLAEELSDQSGRLLVPESRLVELAYWRLKGEQGDAITRTMASKPKPVRKPNSAPVTESIEARKAKKLKEARSLSEYYEWLTKEGLQ